MCTGSFSHIIELISHLKQYHGVSSNDTFKCVQKKCSQKFNNLHKFKLHLTRKHKSTNTNELQEFDLCNTQCTLSESIMNSKISSSATKSTKNVVDFRAELNKIKKSILTFSLELHNKNNLSRKDIIHVQNIVQSHILSPILSYFEVTLTSYSQNASENREIQDVFNILKNPFASVHTEYRLIKELCQHNLYVPHETFTISNEVCEIVKNNTPTLDINKFQMVVMPIDFQIKSYFESQDIYHQTIQNMKDLQSQSEIRNYVNGSLWKNIVKKYKNKIVIPYFMYFDDFEINNPLGPHSGEQKMCGCYYSFPTVPNHHLSKLNNIFIACLFKSKDQSTFGNRAVLSKLIEKIKSLERDGISLEIDGTNVRVYFVLGLVIGDNLGLNTILGFTKSFNSHFYCRACKRNKFEMQKDTKEHSNYLRNVENYNEDVSLNNYKLTGIRENSIFNSIDNFHVIENTCFDIMHDLFEGVCKYTVSKVLLHFITIDKYFSIDVLNYRKQMFQYGETEIGNISQIIELTTLQNNNIKMTASEMHTFIHFLPIILGDLIPRENEMWALITTLVEIIDTVSSSTITDYILKNLDLNIEKFNSLYIEIFEEHLKPKFHFLVHYSSTIKKCGPMKGFWCFRYEAKHKELKTYARVTNSRLNIAVTLSIKSGLKFSNSLITNSFFENDLIEGKPIAYSLLDSIYFQYLILPSNCLHTSYKVFDSLIYKGTKYKRGYYLIKELSLNNKIL